MEFAKLIMEVDMEMIKTVLLADAEAIALDPLIISLQHRHLRVVIATTALDALQALEKHVIDVTVLHLILADIRGIGLIPIIRRRHPETKLIVTADPEMEDHERFARPWGIVTFVIKPYDLRTMTECVDFAAHGNAVPRNIHERI